MKSLIDTVISEQTAEILKDSSFSYPWPIEYIWTKGKLISIDLVETTPLGALIAPSQGLLQKWFAEAHGIYLSVKPTGQYQVETKDSQTISSGTWQKYEDTLEEGIKYIIKTYGHK